jgi:2-oxo-4-hydroxy-4-carboxy-5-ureidoimidazoline decarboxylase
MPATPIPLAALNDMSRREFTAVLGNVFEHAPWVAEKVGERRPFAGVTALHAAMLAVLDEASPETVTAFLNNHPDLAGPAARPASLTENSAREQTRAGLDALTEEETGRLALWNAQYRDRFGFPFILCVRRHSQGSIFAEFARRLAGDPAQERAAALAEIGRITALRLAGKVTGPGPLKVYGELSTHLLDTARGRPAEGVAVELFALAADGSARPLATAVTNARGRTPKPLIAGRPIPIGSYELRFSIGAYFAKRNAAHPPFLELVPVRFAVAEPEGHYHIPLLVSPGGYTTYRGGG